MMNIDAPEYQTWARRFRAEGTSLPLVWVVRSDGEVLYGKGGPIDELIKFLLNYRKQAGAGLTGKQVKDLSTALEKAKKAQADGDMGLAMREIGKFAAVGSYAAV